MQAYGVGIDRGGSQPILPNTAGAEINMNPITLVDVRLQLARALDGLVSAGSNLQRPGWPWRWPEPCPPLLQPVHPSSFVREWVAAGQGQGQRPHQGQGQRQGEALPDRFDNEQTRDEGR